MELVDEYCDMLQVHSSRDKIVSLTCYTLKFWGTTSKRDNLLTASARLASTRAALRLFDDAAYIKALLKYGLGKQEGPLWGTLGVTYNTLTLAYLQAEKVVFLIDTGVLKLSEENVFKCRTAHKLFWSLYTFIGFVRSIKALHASAIKLKDPNRTKCASARFTLASLTTTKMFIDIIHVVNWLPKGWMWGSSLQNSHAAGLATLSGVLGLVIHFRTKQLLP